MYSILIDNLDEMDQFLERLNLPKLTLEEIDNKSITKFVAKTFLKKKMSGPVAS